jgi:hypothetical protein
MINTIRESIKNPSKEPFGLLADKFSIVIGSIFSAAGLNFLFRYSKDVRPRVITERNVHVPKYVD